MPLPVEALLPSVATPYVLETLGEVEVEQVIRKGGMKRPTNVLNQEQTKNLLRQVLVELLEKRSSEFHKLIVEATEEVALVNAIRAGRKDEFVSEDQIRALLEA